MTMRDETRVPTVADVPVLSVGAHASLAEGTCAMEAVSYLAGEPWVIAAFLRRWNDDLPDADRDRLLRPVLRRVVGSRATSAVERRRAWLATDWLVRETAPPPPTPPGPPRTPPPPRGPPRGPPPGVDCCRWWPRCRRPPGGCWTPCCRRVRAMSGATGERMVRDEAYATGRMPQNGPATAGGGRDLVTSIEWTDATWNPVTGCTKVSPGCAHCYAEGVAKRFWKGRPFTEVRCHPERLDQPLRWRKPRRVFVNSMSDLFHEDVPLEFVARVFDVMASATAECGQRHQHDAECWTGDPHRFQVLTKRAERMHGVMTQELPDFLNNEWPGDSTVNVMRGAGQWPLPNVWLGVSVENQATADARIPLLLQTPAAVRFLSCEPLLGRMEIRGPRQTCGDCDPCIGGRPDQCDLGFHLGALHPDGIHWVIVGGESGPGARPCDVGWIRSLVRQCREAGVPAFVKQLGAAPEVTASVLHLQAWPEGVRFERADPDGCAHAYTVRCRDRKGADPAEWPADLRVREWPGVAAETPGVTSA